jgi:uncharacterized protein (DUF1499 family)
MRLLKVNKPSQISAVFFATLMLTACAGQPPTDLGVITQAGSNADTPSFSLRACPDSPNCIQTYDAVDQDHFKTPLKPKANIQQTTQALKAAIKDSGGEIISEKTLSPAGYYLHAEYESKWIRFVDDVEILVQTSGVQIRSASRIGRSDFGVNGERFDVIKDIYQAVP